MEESKREIKNQICLEDEADNEKNDCLDEMLTGVVGEKMYFLDLSINLDDIQENGKYAINVSESDIHKVKIARILYMSDAFVILYGITEEGNVFSFVQDYFFFDYNDALRAVKLLQEYSNNGKKYCEDIYELFEDLIEVKYRYIIKFCMERYDILLNDDGYVVVQEVEADINIEEVRFSIEPCKKVQFIAGKRVFRMSQTSLFQISPLE